MTDNNGPIVITGASNIEAARLLAIRAALRLETRGMKRRGRSARALANEVMGTKHRTARAAYEAYDAYLVDNYGAVPRPLEKENGK